MDELLTWAEINLDAISENIRSIQRHIGPAVEIFAVLKANAYGHGAVALAPVVLQAGATRIAVHRIGEGIELRKAGISAPILLLGYTPLAEAGQVVEWDLIPTVSTLELAQHVSALASAAGKTSPVHVKVDTGLSRFGMMPGEILGFVQQLAGLPGLMLEGLYTHFATADASDQTHIRGQLAVFNDVIRSLAQAGFRIPIIHAANSATIMHLPEAHFNAVRPGISMYGLNPSLELPPAFPLCPAMTLKSKIVRLSNLPVGTAVGYGRTFIASRPTRAGLVIFGYGDGYHRVLSNKGCVLVGGQRAPILGRISMDQIVVDVTDISGVELYDEVVLVGRQGEEQISAEEVGSLAGTVNYEVTTGLLPRVTRVYLQGGQEVSRTGLG